MSSADTDTVPDDQEQPVPAVDHARDALVARLRAALGDGVLDSVVVPGVDVTVRVSLDAWEQTARVCKEQLGLTYFCFLSAIDWLPSPFGKSEDDTAPTVADPDAELAHGVAGGDTRFQLLARLGSPTDHVAVTLKADVPDGAEPPTWSGIYAGADWHERETWEMFGITFAGHPNLCHIYLPGGFEGHPLRKDFPLISRMVKPWPGLVDVEAMPGEPDEDEEADPDAETPAEDA